MMARMKSRGREPPPAQDVHGREAQSRDRGGGPRKMVRPSHRRWPPRCCRKGRDHAGLPGIRHQRELPLLARGRPRTSIEAGPLTDNQRNWGFGLCFLYLRNVRGYGWNHKRSIGSTASWSCICAFVRSDAWCVRSRKCCRRRTATGLVDGLHARPACGWPSFQAVQRHDDFNREALAIDVDFVAIAASHPQPCRSSNGAASQQSYAATTGWNTSVASCSVKLNTAFD